MNIYTTFFLLKVRRLERVLTLPPRWGFPPSPALALRFRLS